MIKEQRKLLKMRAIEMAKEQERILNTSSSEEIIVFSLASESYGIESEFVREVYPLKDFTSLPGLPSFILGIITIPYLIKIIKSFLFGLELNYEPLLAFIFLSVSAFQAFLFAMWMDIQDNERLYK